MDIEEEKGETTFYLNYVAPEGDAVELVIKTWSQVAVSCLDILSLAPPEQFGQQKVKAPSLLLRRGPTAARLVRRSSSKLACFRAASLAFGPCWATFLLRAQPQSIVLPDGKQLE